jgi:acyl-CoA dehydrogenase
MDFALTEEQKMLISTARRFVETELLPIEKALEETGRLDPATARAITEKAKTLGLFALNIPEEYGGGGLNALDNSLVEEEFGRTSDVLVRRSLGNVYEVLLAGTQEQQERWLNPSTRGERVPAVAFTEPGAGSDAAGIKTRAKRDGNGWSLSGQKCFISDGDFADFFIVSAVTDPDAGAKGISLFLVDKGTAGFTVGRDQPMMGLRGTGHVELFFDDVKLSGEHLLGGEGSGLKLTLETLGRIRVMQIGARAVGRATRIFGMMTDYARERRQFGRAIGEYQMIQQMLADSAIEIEATRLMVRRTACAIDAGEDTRNRISMLKVYASEMIGRVADRAVQVFGGMGYCKDMMIEKFYRDARIVRIYDGTSEIHRMVIGRNLMKGSGNVVDPLG